ncbi:MAG: hypothetical protein CMJ18_02365 [Phycisphaeraceae bacterium]|nr:hypothetical protein [Phycisphaeraceae bacterium]
MSTSLSANLLGRLHPSRQPWITRQSYHHELVNCFAFPVAISLIEGTVIGVLAKKTFHVGPWMFATLMAVPMLANVSSYLWARALRGRRKVRSITLIQIGLLASVASIGLLPTNAYGPILLIGLVAIAKVLQTGLITARSTVWRYNYPRAVRARIVGRLSVIANTAIGIAPLAGYAVVDYHPQSFRIIYPLGVGISIIGVIWYSRVRLRGERALLRFERERDARPSPHGTPGPIYEYDPNDTGSFWSVLKKDHFFRRYMKWQFMAGLAAMMSEVIVIWMIVDLTGGFRHPFLISIALGVALPMISTITTMPAWARMLDRVHVTRVRYYQGLVITVVQLLYWIGAAIGSLSVFAVARVVLGGFRGAGILAWQLGHNDFADRRFVAVYMGIHVTLTGVRGAAAPFVAMMLYKGPVSLPDWLGMPAHDGVSHHAMLIIAAMSLIAAVGQRHLARRIARSEAR